MFTLYSNLLIAFHMFDEIPLKLNAEHKIILCRMLEIVYVENNEQFL